MNVTLDKKADNFGVLTIEVQESDYAQELDKKIKDYSKKMNLKGFRPGKVPPGLVKKMYGTSLKVEEINQQASKGMQDFIEKEKIQLLGDPMIKQPDSAIDWDSNSPVKLEFEIGMVPEFDVPMDKKLKLTKYEVEMSDKLLTETIENLQKQYGNSSHPEEVGENDILFGDLKTEDGIEQSISFSIEKLTAAKKKTFLGAKKEEVINFDPRKALAKTDEDLAQMLSLQIDDVKPFTGTCGFTLREITRKEESKLDKAFFEKIYGPDGVKDEAEFKTKVEADIKLSNDSESGNLLKRDIRKVLVDKTKLELPKDFLKRWLLKSNEGKVSEEQVNAELDAYVDELKWNLITNKVREDQKIEVDPKEVEEETVKMIEGQFGANLPGDRKEEFLNQFAQNYLKEGDGKNFNRIFNLIMERKIFDYIETQVSPTTKKVDHEAFKKVLAS